MCLGHTQPLFFGDVCLFNSKCDLIKGIVRYTFMKVETEKPTELGDTNMSVCPLRLQLNWFHHK